VPSRHAYHCVLQIRGSCRAQRELHLQPADHNAFKKKREKQAVRAGLAAKPTGKNKVRDIVHLLPLPRSSQNCLSVSKRCCISTGAANTQASWTSDYIKGYMFSNSQRMRRMHTCTQATHATCNARATHALMNTCTHASAYMHTCTHAHKYTCTHAHKHTCTHAHMHTCTHAYMHTCNHANAHKHACNCTQATHVQYVTTYGHTYRVTFCSRAKVRKRSFVCSNRKALERCHPRQRECNLGPCNHRARRLRPYTFN
jgi:hypothetical protein